MSLDEECIAALREVAAAEENATPVNPLRGVMSEHPMQIGHLMFEGFIEPTTDGDLHLTERGHRELERIQACQEADEDARHSGQQILGKCGHWHWPGD